MSFSCSSDDPAPEKLDAAIDTPAVDRPADARDSLPADTTTATEAGDAPTFDAPATDTHDAPTAPLNTAFAQRAQQIAADYIAWGRVDDELRWAPGLCRIPLPGIARPSKSTDQATHGNKLYSVFVKHRDAYPTGSHAEQAVVKQSWTAEREDNPDAAYAPQHWRHSDGGDHFYPYARDDNGAIFRAAAPAGLYIMFKLDPATPDTDRGWVYATILPDGRVTSAGPVGSCIRCHEDAPHDRLFGVPKTHIDFRP